MAGGTNLFPCLSSSKGKLFGSFNVVHRLHMRQMRGNLHAARGTFPVCKSLYGKVPGRLAVPLKDIVDPVTLVEDGHVFLGFSKDGCFVLSYTLTLDFGESSAMPFYMYKLHWWRFRDQLPMERVSEVNLFAGEKIHLGLHLAVCSWPTDRTKILVYGCTSLKPTVHEKLVCYVSVTAVPPLVPCASCLHMKYSEMGVRRDGVSDSSMELIPPELAAIFGSDPIAEPPPPRCLRHSFAVHTQFEMSPPFPGFSPIHSMKKDGVVILNSGDTLIAVSVCLATPSALDAVLSPSSGQISFKDDLHPPSSSTSKGTSSMSSSQKVPLFSIFDLSSDSCASSQTYSDSMSDIIDCHPNSRKVSEIKDLTFSLNNDGLDRTSVSKQRREMSSKVCSDCSISDSSRKKDFLDVIVETQEDSLVCQRRGKENEPAASVASLKPCLSDSETVQEMGQDKLKSLNVARSSLERRVHLQYQGKLPKIASPELLTKRIRLSCDMSHESKEDNSLCSCENTSLSSTQLESQFQRSASLSAKDTNSQMKETSSLNRSPSHSGGNGINNNIALHQDLFSRCTCGHIKSTFQIHGQTLSPRPSVSHSNALIWTSENTGSESYVSFSNQSESNCSIGTEMEESCPYHCPNYDDTQGSTATIKDCTCNLQRIFFSVRRFVERSSIEDSDINDFETSGPDYNNMISLNVTGPSDVTLVKNSSLVSPDVPCIEVRQITMDAEHYICDAICKQATWGRRYIAFTDYDMNILDVCWDTCTVYVLMKALVRAWPQDRHSSDIFEFEDETTNDTPKVYQTGFSFAWNLKTGKYETLHIDDLAEFDQSKLLKVWNPGFLATLQLQRRLMVPMSHANSVHILTNDAVFKNKSLTKLLDPVHYVAIILT